ncbi:MAG: DNA primase [Geminicoccaceae bacterium]|nr:DNA primase [Geminicoccaceae bacterium]
MGGPSLDDFKAKLPLAEIVARYVRLVRRGREHSGLCPFHKEKTPSFNVVEDKGFYHCFGCGAHGNAIDFVMAVEGLPFADALRRLADMTGIEAPTLGRGEARAPQERGLIEANEAATRFFANVLWSDAGAEARAYLRRRGCGRRVVERFRLGCAPNGNQALLGTLKAEGFTEDLLLEAGLVARREDGGGLYDRFRHRLMFPIEDGRGRVVGFGGRALGEARAKYLNTPETPAFHKGRLLYGLPQAVKAARERRRIVLVEGYMDVVALSEAGIGEAVAPLGTAVTEDQLRLLWRHAEAPVVCLDGDQAGLAAALRTARRALPVMEGGRSLRFALLPEGEDPDSLVRSKGAEAMRSLLDDAMPLSRMIREVEWTAEPVTTPEAFAALRHRLLDYPNLAGDPGLRLALRDDFFNFLKANRLGGQRKDSLSPPQFFGVRARFNAALERVGGDLLAAILRWPAILSEFEEDFADVEFDQPAREDLRREILVWHASEPALDAAGLRDHLSRHGFTSLAEDVLAASEKGFAPGSDTTDVIAVQQIFGDLRRKHARRRESEALDSISSSADAAEKIEKLTATFRGLNQLLNGGGKDVDH